MSVTRKLMCSGVWPGVSSALMLDVADVEDVAVFEEAGVGISLRPLELPVGPAFCGEIGGRAVALHQLARAAQVVGVDVGVRDGGDAQVVFRGDLEIAVEVALGIDDDGLAGALAADEVGVLGERGIGDLAEEHGSGWLDVRSNRNCRYTMPDRWFHGILASSMAMPHQSVMPAKVSPAPTKALRP